MRIEFAQSFADRLSEVEAFIQGQDESSAPERIEDLHTEVLRFVDLVKLHPAIGRRAELLGARSAEGQKRLLDVLQLALETGLPDLREYVLRAHVLLYAHSSSRVLMLSIRHQRELSYTQDAERELKGRA